MFYGNYMEYHAMLESMDKHILFLEYSIPSLSTGETWLSFLDHNQLIQTEWRIYASVN